MIMRTLVVITSIVVVRPGTSIYTPQQRYQQVVTTIQDVKAKIPDATIVVVEGSRGVDVGYPDVLTHRVDNLNDVSFRNKSVGEAMLLLDFFHSDLYKKLTATPCIVIKMSGRYRLDDNFSISTLPQLRADKISCRQGYFNSTHQRLVTITILYSFPSAMTYHILHNLEKCISKCWTLQRDIEETLLEETPADMIHPLAYLGVYGNEAPSGRPVEY